MKGVIMKQFILVMLLWQCYLFSADDISPSPIDIKNAFDTAVNNRDQKASIKFFAQFQLIAAADSKYCNLKQVDHLSVLYDHFTHQILTIFHLDDIQGHLLEARKQEISSLITKIERDQLYLCWPALIGEFDHQLSENELMWHRIAFLKKLKEYYEQEA